MKVLRASLIISAFLMGASSAYASAQDIRGFRIGMPEGEARGLLALDFGEYDEDEAENGAVQLSAGPMKVAACNGSVVYVERVAGTDFHTFTDMVQTQTRRLQRSGSSTIYTMERNGQQISSVGYVWHSEGQPIYGIHYSKAGDETSVVELLDPPAEELESIVQECSRQKGA